MLNVAIIGAGYWGPNLVRNFDQLKDVNVHTICDINQERLDYIKTQYPKIKITRNYDIMLRDTQIDAVVISLPIADHYWAGKKSLLAKKHTFIEKPLALSVSECEELIRLSEENRKMLFVGHTFEYNAAVKKVKESINEGLLGDIYYIYSQRLNLGRVRKESNVMWNLAPHDISIILYWLGEEPVSISAKGVSHLQNRVEDAVFLNMDFSNRKTAYIHASWLHPNKIRRMTIVGSQKTVVYDDVSPTEKVCIYDKGVDKKNVSQELGKYNEFGQFLSIRRAGDLFIPKIDFIEPLKLECAHFIECVRENKKPLTDGKNGLRVVRVLEAAQKSLENNGLTVELHNRND